MQSKLPNRWVVKHGAYYFRVPPGQEDQWEGKKWFRLGRTEGEAYRVWFERVPPDDGDITTMNDLFDSWWAGYVIPYLAESTRKSYEYHLLPLRKVFGHLRPESIRASHAYKYRHKRPRVAGNREVSVMSSALTYAVGIGLVENNPLRGQVSRRGASAEPSRKRVPTLGELEHFCRTNPRLRGYVALKSITGLRQGQLLRINLTDHWDEKSGTLTPPTAKGGRNTQYEGPGLPEAINQILGSRLPRGYLFLNRRGERTTASGFRSAWRRAQAKFVGVGGERFNEHDIRKTVATLSDSLEHARKLLGHQDTKTTAKSYRVGPEKVRVLKSVRQSGKNETA